MKKVIFVCLLSLSVCFSQPSTQEAAAQTPAVVSKQNAAATDAKAITEAKSEPPQKAVSETPTTPPVVVEAPPSPPVVETPATLPVVTAGAKNATASDTHTVPVSKETSTPTNETKPAENNNSTETKPSADPAKTVDPLKGNNETKPAGNVPANNGTNADSKDSKDGKKNETTTTPKGDNVRPTVAPVEAKSRAFDGPSFIGGIILTLGLLAIGFMGFKYYKNQTERNYHTL